jgi:TP901 family phage tail tape measure protein
MMATAQFAYRGRRSQQAMRQDTLANARAMAILGSASIGAANSVAASVDRMGAKLTRLAQISSVILTGVLAKDLIGAGVSFQKAMSSVEAFTEGTARQMQMLSGRAKELGQSMVFSATEVAEAMQNLALAGFAVEQIYTIIPDVMNLAAAGQLEMAEAATIASDTIRNMNMDVTEFTAAVDIMAKTASTSNQTIRDVGQAFTFVGPLAAGLGMRFTEVNAALGVLANRGLRAERGGTALRRIMAEMLSELQKGNRGLSNFNITLFDAEGRFIGLANAMDAIKASGAGVREYMESMQQRAGPAFISLMQASSDAVREFEAALITSAGTADKIAKTRIDNLAGRFKLLQDSIRRLAIEVFERLEPAVSRSVESWTEFFKSIQGSERITEIASGLARAFKLLITFVGILIGLRMANVILGWANALWGIGGAAGAASGSMVVLGSTARAAAWNLDLARIELMHMQGQAIAGRASMLSLGSAVGIVGAAFAGWQIGRMISELTPLGGIVRDLAEEFNLMWDAAMGGDDMEARVDAMRDQFALIVKQLDAIRAEGFEGEEGGVVLGDIGVPEPDFTALEAKLEAFYIYLETGNINMAKNTLRELERMQSGLSAYGDRLTDLTQLGRRFMTEHPEQWETAKVALRDYVTTLGIAGELVEVFIEETEERMRRQAERDAALMKIRENAIEALGEVYLNHGILLERMAEKSAAAFGAMVEHAAGNEAKLRAIADEFSDDIIQLGDAISRDVGGMAKDLPEDLRNAIAVLYPLALALQQLEEQGERTDEALQKMNSNLKKIGYVTAAEVAAFVSDTLVPALGSFEDKTKGASVVANAFAEDIVRLVESLKKQGDAVPLVLVGLYGLAQGYVAVAEGAELAEKAMTKFESKLWSAGMATTEMAESMLSDTLIPAFEQLSGSMQGIELFFVAFGEDIDDLIERLRVAGEEIPEILEHMQALGNIAGPPDPGQWEEFFSTIQSSSQEFIDNVGTGFAMIFDRGITAMSQAAGQAIVFGSQAAGGLTRAIKQVAAQAIGFLVEWAIRRLVVGKITAATAAAEGAAQVGLAYALTFANTMASMSLAPWPVNLTAPLIAAEHLGIVSSVTPAAGATGAAVGAAVGMVALAEQGALITSDTIFRGGERNQPEAVVPLRGWAADMVANALGLDEIRSGIRMVDGASSSEMAELRSMVRELVNLGPGIQVTGIVEGDAVGGSFNRDFIERVAEELFDLIDRGRILAPGGISG